MKGTGERVGMSGLATGKVGLNGFTFEYSATFGEALNSGNRSQDIEMRQAYGRSIVFDYSYKIFMGMGDQGLHHSQSAQKLQSQRRQQPGHAAVGQPVDAI